MPDETRSQALAAMRQALAQIRHPEIDHTLGELGMIRHVEIGADGVRCAVAIPFKEIPIKDQLAQLVTAVVRRQLGNSAMVHVDWVEMSQAERANFLAMAQGEPAQGQHLSQIDHVIAVMSGKGGVGKSSVASMLAVSLRRRGLRVGLLDADITGPSIPKLFGVHDRPEPAPLGIMPVKTGSGIRLMSINLLLPNEDDAVIWRGPLISSAIKQFWGEVFWGDLDYLIVDLPPGTSDASLTVMQSIPLSGILLVTSPQELAGMVVRKAARMAQQLTAPILGLIENMSYVECGRCGERLLVFGPSHAAETALQIGVPLLGQIPLDPEMARLGDEGHIESFQCDAFERVVDSVIQMMPAERTKPFAATREREG